MLLEAYMLDSERCLIDVLRDKSPILLLGAGFSCGAQDGENRPILIGKELARELFDKILSKASIDAGELEELRKHRDDLRQVCVDIYDESLVKERDVLLIKRMSGCHCPKDSFHHKIKKYPWSYIFSLNIDDLVENIYGSKKISVQINGGYTQADNGSPVLLKLHGSVTEPQKGFVFDSDEYTKFMASSNWLLTLFGTEYLMRDVIIIGSEFQEDDLRLILEKFRGMTGVTKDLNYFFVTPKISNRSLRRKIETTSNMHHIEFTAQEFFDFIEKNVINVGEQRKRFRDYGMVFLDEKKREQLGNMSDVANLYLGEIPRYHDIFGDWDIRYPDLSDQVHKQIQSKRISIVSLYGNPYVGKSCIAMRLLVDFLNEGYQACELKLDLSLNAPTYLRIIEDYLSSVNKDSRVAILLENCSILYDGIRNITKSCSPNVQKLVVVTTANTSDHNVKKYLFDNIPQWSEYYVTEKISHRYANNIYQKLSQKNHLNKLSAYGSSRQDIAKHIHSLNDIVDVLYVSQEGRGFYHYYAEWLKTRSKGIYQDAFTLLSFFSQIHLDRMPVVLFSEISQGISTHFDFATFQQEYCDVIRIQDGSIRIRCSRLLNKVLSNEVGIGSILMILANSAQIVGKNLQDQEVSVRSDLYQKLLKVKVLLDVGLSKHQVLQLMNQVKPLNKHLSYFWIQFGIINRDLEYFEEANNAFREAARVRGRPSYQIQHSEAKNYMEWGIWELHNHESQASFIFDQGKEKMMVLINEAPHRYFSYSVHTYIDMMLRYSNTSKIRLSEDEVQYISELMKSLLYSVRDDYSTSICRNFINIYRNDMKNDDITAIEFLLASRGTPHGMIDHTLDFDMLSDDIDVSSR
jgi:hypothetical protein